MYDAFLNYFVVWNPGVAAISAGAIAADDEGLIHDLFRYPDGSLQFTREQFPRLDKAWAAAGRLGFSFEQNTRWRSLAAWGKTGFGLLIPEEHFLRLGGERGIMIGRAAFSSITIEEYELRSVEIEVVFNRRRSRSDQPLIHAVRRAIETVNHAFSHLDRGIEIASEISEQSRTLTFSVNLTKSDQTMLNALILFALGWGGESRITCEVRVAEGKQR